MEQSHREMDKWLLYIGFVNIFAILPIWFVIVEKTKGAAAELRKLIKYGKNLGEMDENLVIFTNF